MLSNDPYTTYLLTQMKIDDFHSTADRLRTASLFTKRREHQRKAVLSILHGTGKALIKTGNRLLEIA
ncbi:MAG: hypothetical protein JEY91_09075 [Spirochaetaceae bacterium]|nr:hypothetical protein [Spirochaetaceae bacterium]